MAHRDDRHSAKWRSAIRAARGGDTAAWRKILRDGPREAVFELFSEYQCAQGDTRWGVKNMWSSFAGVLRLKALKFLNSPVRDGGVDHGIAIEMLKCVSKPQDHVLMLEIIDRDCYDDERTNYMRTDALEILRDIAPNLQYGEKMRVSQVMTTMLMQGLSERYCVDVLRWMLPFQPAEDALLFIANEGGLFSRSGLALLALLEAAPAEYLELAERLVSELALDYVDERRQSRRDTLFRAIASAQRAVQLGEVGRRSLLQVIAYLDEISVDPEQEQEFMHIWDGIGGYDEAQEECLNEEFARRFEASSGPARRFMLNFFSNYGAPPSCARALLEIIEVGKPTDVLLALDAMGRTFLWEVPQVEDDYVRAVISRVEEGSAVDFIIQVLERTEHIDGLCRARWRWLCDEGWQVEVRVAAAKCCEDIIGAKRPLDIERFFGASPDELRWKLQLVHDRIDAQHRELLVLVRQFLRDLRDAGLRSRA